MKDIADMNVKSRSEVTNVEEFQFIVLPNGKKRYYKKPDMSRVDKATADCIYDAIENHRRPDAAIAKLKKEIAEEDAHLRKLAKEGIRI